MVNRANVDAYVSESFDASLYTVLASLFLGAALSTIASLVTGVKHPVPLYMLLTAESVLGVAFLIQAIREHIQRKRAREQMLATAVTFTTPFGVPPKLPTGTHSSDDTSGEPKTSSTRSLTKAQADLLAWMVETGADSFVAETMLQGVTILMAIGGSSQQREVNGSDFRELEHQGFIRHTTGHGYDLTNAGRSAYEELRPPPP